MEFYGFEVRRGKKIIAAERSIPFYSPRAAWPKFIKLAKSLETTDCRIRVKEHVATVVPIAVAAALRCPDFDFSAAA